MFIFMVVSVAADKPLQQHLFNFPDAVAGKPLQQQLFYYLMWLLVNRFSNSFTYFVSVVAGKSLQQATC
jgi:hypothetical protein